MADLDHNGADAELKRRVDRRCAVLNEIAEKQDELSGLKAEDKADGYDEKALAHCVKMKRADPEKVAALLTLEQVIDTYRRAAKLPRTVEEAQVLVRDDAGALPDPDETEAAE